MCKVILITGASSGIGRACAYFLAKQDFIVYAGSRTPSKLDISHSNLHPINLDLTNYEKIKETIEMIHDKHKRLDVVINNAGYGLISSVEYASEEEMQEQFDINVFSIFRICKAAIPYMKNKKKKPSSSILDPTLARSLFLFSLFILLVSLPLKDLRMHLLMSSKG